MGIGLLIVLTATLGGILRWLGVHCKSREDSLVDRIDRLLPQLQCAQCGYPGCRPYAEAIAQQKADIDLCPPGGEAAIQQLAALLGRSEIPQPAPYINDQVAQIDETACIGCMKCIHACPVDAIVGTSKRMHTVLTEACTGCALCVAPCPVDCITLHQQET